MKGLSLGALAVAATLVAAPPAWTQANDEPAPDPEALIEEGVRNFLSAIELMLMAIPRYAPPEVLPNGDILIRRLPPPEENGADPPAERDGEREI